MSLSKRDLKLADLFARPSNFFAFGFGSGLVPYAPGTAGTIVGVPIVVLFGQSGDVMLLLTTALFFVAGIWICRHAAEYLEVHDHGGIVWDEIVGFMVCMCFIPITWNSMLVGFLLFRFFDVMKPWPIRVVDRKVSGGFGIMLDDVIAGVFANVLLQLLVRANWL
ncbi:MAG: phosphatidylglycerophosphatase A [Pseudomonadota bacterium]